MDAVPSPTPAVTCRGLIKQFGSVRAVDGMDLVVPEGGITALLGPSGCGKTTALRMIAGFERPDVGSIHLHDTVVSSDDTHVRPEHRRVGMVFQDYALFPHLTVQENVEYGLAHLPRDERRRRAGEALDLVDLAPQRDRLPAQLSGGQQQRVALARALAPSPEVILLDEPFSNLDAALRVQVREEVRQILLAAEATAIVVTHDQEEALSLADQVAVMEGGRVHQVAPPRTLYTRPATAFVARFVGDADLVPCEVTHGGRRVATPLGALDIVEPVHSARAEVVVRPESLRLIPAADGNATVTDLTFFGHDQLIHVELADGTRLRSRQGPDADVGPGDRVRISHRGPAVAFPVGAPIDQPAVA